MLAATVGCGPPPLALEGRRCDEDADRAGARLVCRDGACEQPGEGEGGGEGEGEPPPNSDSDGRHDAADNCPTAPNANQHREDAAGRREVCDDCPATLNANQRDGDGDGVGDACDLRPDTPGDAIAFIEPFHGTAAPEWRARFGSFTVQNNQLVP
ncbi:MAG: hypothetical protein FJ137_03355 [Deltaproteobacteria bacterium]|nr:hypothetical protein [Deltaproteobacteria bacterium]